MIRQAHMDCRKKVVSVLLIAVVLAMAGCGGSGVPPINSALIGNYTGSWTNSINSHTGTATIEVQFGGHVAGNFHDDTAGTDLGVSATLDGTGKLIGTIQDPYPSTTPLSGTLATSTASPQTRLTGTLWEHSDFQLFAAYAISLNKQ